ATCATGYPQDLFEKFQRAKEYNGKGLRYIEILSSCPPGWGHKTSESVEVTKLGVESGYWPLMEVIEGKLVISNPSKRYLDKSKRKDVRKYLKMQSRFKHFTEKDYKVWEDYIDDLWQEIRWELEKQGDL
ncbi:MAG: pyruvate synthase subunit beta, partial [Promethearchaeota archaeon]